MSGCGDAMHMTLADDTATHCTLILRPDAPKLLARMARRRLEGATARSEMLETTDPARRAELARQVLNAQFEVAMLWLSLLPPVYGGEMPESVGDDGADVDHPTGELLGAA